jgi:hypothetical protein
MFEDVIEQMLTIQGRVSILQQMNSF